MRLGCPLTCEFWDYIEEDVGDIGTYCNGDPEGQQDYIENYRNVGEKKSRSYCKPLCLLTCLLLKQNLQPIERRLNLKRHAVNLLSSAYTFSTLFH